MIELLSHRLAIESIKFLNIFHINNIHKIKIISAIIHICLVKKITKFSNAVYLFFYSSFLPLYTSNFMNNIEQLL
jgi:hypothetical protein